MGAEEGRKKRRRKKTRRQVTSLTSSNVQFRYQMVLRLLLRQEKQLTGNSCILGKNNILQSQIALELIDHKNYF